METLEKQETMGLFRYSIVVVDNDCKESAKETVAKAQRISSVSILYDVEPEQNISLARNKALKIADSDFFACIDDDEFASAEWLVHLYKAAKEYAADGVLGPVLPFYEIPPPAWVTKGAFFYRKSFPTGRLLRSEESMRTGNFMISKKMIQESKNLFNPEFGLTGGEDSDFFKRMVIKNYSFVWCQEALVYETIPSTRLTRSYLLKRALLRGVSAAERASFMSFDTLKSFVAFLSYTPILPFLLLFRHHVFLRYLISDFDHIGKLMARCGIKTKMRWSNLAPPGLQG